MKVYPPILASPTILEQLRTVGMRTDMSVSYTPFGTAPGTVYIKGAPLTKGVKTIEAIRALGPSGQRIAAGLERAIALSRAHREIGTAMVVVAGEVKLMPAKAAEMLKAGRFGQVVRPVVKVVKPITRSAVRRGLIGRALPA